MRRITEIQEGKIPLDRKVLEDLFLDNLTQILGKHPEVLRGMKDNDLKKGTALALYFCNVVLKDKNRTKVMEQIGDLLDIPQPTLRRWIPSKLFEPESSQLASPPIS